MSNHLFPVKMAGIIKYLANTETFNLRYSPAGTINAPDDGKFRVLVCSSELNHAIKNEPDFKDLDQFGLRKRIAVPSDASFLGLCEETMFEVYDIDGVLIKSEKLCQVTGYLAAALEVELLVMMLKHNGVDITMM